MQAGNLHDTPRQIERQSTAVEVVSDCHHVTDRRDHTFQASSKVNRSAAQVCFQNPATTAVCFAASCTSDCCDACWIETETRRCFWFENALHVLRVHVLLVVESDVALRVHAFLACKRVAEIAVNHVVIREDVRRIARPVHDNRKAFAVPKAHATED